MTKKIIAIALIILTVVGVFAVTASASDYSTGSYTVTRNGGLNVRRGAGVAYEKIGMAQKGTAFIVSKIDGSWGYTAAVRCDDGVTRSGWLRISYCKYNDGTRSTYNDVFATSNADGNILESAVALQSDIFTKGEFVYVWGYLHDGSGNLYKSYALADCDLTVSVYRPDGSCAYTATYADCDNAWIGQKLDVAGNWKIQSEVSGALTGVNTKTITVKENDNKYTLIYNANGGSGALSAQKVQAGSDAYLSSAEPIRHGYKFLGWNTKRTAKTARYLPSDKIEITKDTTLYAVWEKLPVEPTRVSLSAAKLTLKTGGTKTLKATVYPKDAKDKSVTWSTSDSDVVSVSKKGKITAKSAGIATVTATTENGKTAECTVTVKGIVISGQDGYTAPVAGDVYYLDADVYPDNGKKLTWSSSDNKIVAVTSDGKITAKKQGNATITVKSSDGTKKKVKITVSAADLSDTGRFDGVKNYSGIALNKSADSGSFYVYTYNAAGEKTTGDIHIDIRDADGDRVREFNVSSGEAVTLDDGLTEYRIYISRKQSSHNAADKNRYRSWVIDCADNCYIK